MTLPKTAELSESGTHVLTLTPTGDSWWCPVEFWPFASKKGYTAAGEGATPPGDGLALTAFDPSEYDVAGVNAYLADQAVIGNTPEIERVLAAEAAGKDRSTIQAPTEGDS